MERSVCVNILIFIILGCSCNAQTYFGKDRFGKLEFANDSILYMEFINTNGKNHRVEAYYYENDDTIFISTKLKSKAELQFSDAEIRTSPGGFPVLIKSYIELNNKLTLGDEGCFGYYDTVANQIIVNNLFVKNGEILVFKDGPFYCRIKVITDKSIERYFTINTFGGFDDVICLQNFPVLKKHHTIIPLSPKLNEKCWLENGFYFPKMKLSAKDKTFFTIPRWSIGLMGLPYYDLK
ncbi:MAG TPA: hypothetical protein PK124_04425 [Bacteroidales bacterium]|nr:hypothetical protein [Bacteroidales bacterium]